VGGVCDTPLVPPTTGQAKGPTGPCVAPSLSAFPLYLYVALIIRYTHSTAEAASAIPIAAVPHAKTVTTIEFPNACI